MVQILDIEWLLSTLFDASLLSTLSRRRRRLFFCSCPIVSHFGPLRHCNACPATMSPSLPAGFWTPPPRPVHAAFLRRVGEA